MGASGVDVQLSSAAKVCFPFGVECKNQEAVGPIYTMFEQALANDQWPVLVVKKNNEKPLAILDAELFIFLMKERHERA